jgi:exonuclease III
LLQETHGTVSDIEKWGQKWKDLGGNFSLWNDRERASRGVAILFNTGQGVLIKEDKKDNDGRVLSCEIKIENQIYKLINIYCPNNNEERKQLI